MEQITFNPNNEPYYSEDFIKGFKCGAERQFEADKKDRPQGQWIYCEDDSGHDGYKCSECGYFVPWCYDAQSCDFIWNYNFCPHCNADMRERKDFQVIVNGNCAKCGKPLSGNRIFICEECEEQSKESE